MSLRDQKGLALVETAISLMLLFAVVFAITEFGRALYIKNTLTNAAREGARRASLSGTSTLDSATAIATVRQVIPFDQSGIDIQVTAINPPSGTFTRGQSAIQVVVTLPFHPLVPFRLVPIRDGMPLTGQAQMLYE